MLDLESLNTGFSRYMIKNTVKIGMFVRRWRKFNDL